MRLAVFLDFCGDLCYYVHGKRPPVYPAESTRCSMERMNQMKRTGWIAVAAALTMLLTSCKSSGMGTSVPDTRTEPVRYTLTVNDPDGWLLEQPENSYSAGETVTIKTEILNDTDLEALLDGISIGTQTAVKTGEEYTHWEYTFTMPDHDATLSFRLRENTDMMPGFQAQAIRTNGYHPGMEYPKVVVIRSAEELENYCDTNQGRWQLDGLREAAKGYDDAYFRDRILLLVLVEASSGSVRYTVTGLQPEKDGLTVHIRVDAPEYGTSDMAEWHILIEPPAGMDIADASHVNVVFDLPRIDNDLKLNP